MDFFQKNVAVFDIDEEENKHEYKQIFEEYIYILESVIDIRLKEMYSESAIEKFYVDFSKSGGKAGAYDNQDVIETLLGFTDF